MCAILPRLLRVALLRRCLRSPRGSVRAVELPQSADQAGRVLSAGALTDLLGARSRRRSALH